MQRRAPVVERWLAALIGAFTCALLVGHPCMGVAAAGTSASASLSNAISLTQSASASSSNPISYSASASSSTTTTPSATRFDYAMNLTCPDNVTAGTVVTCDVLATFGAAPLGTQGCVVVLTVCGATTRQHFNNATLLADGWLRFAFVPTVADTLLLTASFNGTALVANTTVVVKPAAIVLSRSDSKCAVVEASGTTSVCTAFWRDRFGNVAKTCNTTYEHGAASDQATAVCSVL